VSSESNTIGIGDTSDEDGCALPCQTAANIAGIAGVNVTGTSVLVSSTGQLGVAVPSRRLKHQIANMGAESDLLLKLRPVAFYYKPELDQTQTQTQTRQYGLVAEEVAQVAPQLVVYDNDGKPQTVRYHFVNAMLLNEVQKQQRVLEQERRLNGEQQRLLEEQQRTNEEQEEEISRQQAEIRNLAARLAKLEALVTPKP